MASTLDQVVEAVTEIRDQIRSDRKRSQGAAPSWMWASVIVNTLCLGITCVMVALLYGMSQRISDMQSRISADQVTIEMYKIRNEERTATDRLLITGLKERVTKLEMQQ